MFDDRIRDVVYPLYLGRCVYIFEGIGLGVCSCGQARSGGVSREGSSQFFAREEAFPISSLRV